MRRLGAYIALIPISFFCAASGWCASKFQIGESFKDCPVCPEMVVVPAGSFTMGSGQDEPGRDATQGPKHQVKIAGPFSVARFPVTFTEWEACVAGKGCGGYKPDDSGWGRGDRPVINVSWSDAKLYIAWLSQKTGNTYRLPSEAEREYVTRAGTATSFWCGAAIAPDMANYNGNYANAGAARKGEYRQKTLPVWSFEPNPWGLYQVHGNVWEWVEDCWHANYTGAPQDGTAWAGENSCRRAVRGGAWDRVPQALISASRMAFASSYRYNMIGFRVAKSGTEGAIKLPPRGAPPGAVVRVQPPAAPRQSGPAITLVSSAPPAEEEGFVDGWHLGDGIITLRGWGFWRPDSKARMMVKTNLPAGKVSLKVFPRADVVAALNDPRLANSGFEVIISLEKDIPLPDTRRVCLWTEDPVLGSRKTHGWDLCP